MAFKQYTKCVDAADYQARLQYISVASLLAGTPAALITVALGQPQCLWIVLAIYAAAAAVAYYHNWLYSRLICLGGDRDCVGAIVSIGGPTELGLNFLDRDTDYSINLLLKNTSYGPSEDSFATPADEAAAKAALQVAAQQSQPYGELVTPQPQVTAIMTVEGHFATDAQTGQIAATLHAEFEGDGNYKMLQASKVALAVSIYALVACLLGPLGGLFAAAILILALLGLFITSLLTLSGEGTPSDVDAGELTDNTGTNANGQGVGADIVYVQGAWVCDTLHERWNELHPIKKCMKCGTWDGSWPQDDIILRIRHGFEVAQDPATVTAQAQPQNQWSFHPDLDGCVADGPIL